MIKHYFKIAFRNIFRHKTQSIISVLGLMGGIVCFSVCTYYTRQINREDSCFPDYDRMAKVFIPRCSDRISFYKSRLASGEDLKEFFSFVFDEVEHVARYNRGQTYTLEFEPGSFRHEAYSAKGISVNSDFPYVYPSAFREGSIEAFVKHPHGAFVSASFAKRISSEESVLGKSFSVRYSSLWRLPEPKTYVIVGVIEDYPPCTSFSPFMSEVFLKDEEVMDRATLLLKEGAGLSRMNERLDYMKPYRNMGMVKNETRVYRASDMRKPFLPVAILSLISFLVLLVGVVNFMSFSTGAFLNRNRDLSLRRTLGGGFAHLVGLLFTEMGVVIAFAVLLSVAVSETLVPFLFSLIPDLSEMQTLFRIDLKKLFAHQFQYGFSLLVAALFVSLAGAYNIRRRSLVSGRRGSVTGSRNRLRNCLLGLQLFISLLFMYATGFTVCLFNYAYNTYEGKEGMEINRNLTMELSLDQYMLQEKLEEIMADLSSKEWCGLITPYGMSHNIHKYNEEYYSFFIYFVDPGYLERKNLTVLEESADSGDYFCLVNRSYRELMDKDTTHLFTTVQDEGITYPVTGMVDYEFGNNNVVFISRTGQMLNKLSVDIKVGSDRMKVRGDITEVIDAYLPDGAFFNFRIPGEKMDPMTIFPLKLTVTFFLVCAAICVLITVLGLYGAVTMDTNRRQKEVAIRKINGAKGGNVLWMFGKLYLSLYLGAALFATSLTYGLLMIFDDAQNSFRYKDPWIYVSVLLIAAAIVVMTILYRLWLIMRLNPTESLKTE